MIGSAKNVISKSNRVWWIPSTTTSVKSQRFSCDTGVAVKVQAVGTLILINASREIKWRPAPVSAANSNPLAPRTLAARMATAARAFGGDDFGSDLALAFAFPSLSFFLGGGFLGASALTCAYWQLEPWTQPLGIWKKMQGVLDFSSAVRGTLPLPFPFPFSPLSPFPFGPLLGSAAKAGADLSPLSAAAFGGMALAGAPLILGGGGFCSLRFFDFNEASMDKAFWSSRSSTKNSWR